MSSHSACGGRVASAWTPLFLLLPFLLPAASCSGSEDAARATLRFAAIPDDNTTELREKYDRVAAYLAAQLGVPVAYVPTASYAASVEAFKNGDVQLAWFGGLTGVQARAAVDGARAIAQGRVDPHFRSYFVAHAGTGLERSEEFPLEMQGRSFTFGSAQSTSGRLMPQYFVQKHAGVAVEEFFAGEPGYSGSHDKTAKLVEAGTYEVGAMNFKTYDRMVEEGALDPRQCRVIWVTPEYPDYNWTAHPMLDERFGDGFVERVQEVLVGIEDPEILEAAARPGGLIPADNEDFRAIRELARELDFLS